MVIQSRNPNTRLIYEFIKAHRDKYPVEVMCQELEVAQSGYYAWLQKPVSDRALEDSRLLVLIRASYRASHGIYGARRVFLDLREAGETCSLHRVERIMRLNKIVALHGYRTRHYSVGKPSVLIPNLVKRQFTVEKPNAIWSTDITYIRTWEGWLYLAVVMDLFSRKIVGWATWPTIHRGLVLDAVIMAVRRRRPKGTIIHSDQGVQFGSDDWRRFCRKNGLEPSMSRRGNCWDNAVAESFFASLKKERIKKRIYNTREQATSDVRDYIESFYNCRRRHSYIGGVSPDDFEAATKRRKR
jgi:putative transposase